MSGKPLREMDERQLRAALGGAMAWQEIVQKRHGGPEDVLDALHQTNAICREIRRREQNREAGVGDDMILENDGGTHGQ
jgi:hypothetical protein